MNTLVWLASFPKSGNTWSRIFLNNYLADGDRPVTINDLDEGTHAANRPLFDHLTGLESSDLLPEEATRFRPHMYRQWAREVDDVLFVKVHDRWQLTDRGEPLFPPEATRLAVYIVRNPLDIVASFAAHYAVTTDEAIARMSEEKGTISAPPTRLQRQLPQHVGSWSAHVRGWTTQTALPLLVLRYEEMLADPPAAFGRLVTAIGLPLETGRLAKAIAFSDFRQLRRQEETVGFMERVSGSSRFFRRGRSGGWREELTPAQAARVWAAHGEVMARFGYGIPAQS